jgi:thioredoxin-related protein
MKAKLEGIANVVVIVLALVVGFVFLRERLIAPAEVNEVKLGERLIRLEGWDWGAHDRTLVLVLRKGCHFCEDSIPFYQRLAGNQEQGSTTATIAVFPDAADAVKEIVKKEGLDVQPLVGVTLDRLNVSATPTLLLVDKSGTVLNIWVGMLSPKQEVEVMRAMACSGGRCREPG